MIDISIDTRSTSQLIFSQHSTLLNLNLNIITGEQHEHRYPEDITPTLKLSNNKNAKTTMKLITLTQVLTNSYALIKNIVVDCQPTVTEMLTKCRLSIDRGVDGLLTEY